jgi:hypothetical protein
MIFKINESKETLIPFWSDWHPKEADLEHYILQRDESEAPMLNGEIFGEPLLIISNQVYAKYRKRADILALDRHGNSVIVELKRDKGALGVETQVIQYLADFSRFKGRDFIERFRKDNSSLEENVTGFLGADVDVNSINTHNRIMLMARYFDPTIFSMGEWLSEKGIAFRCIAYTPVAIGNDKFLSFSVAFDRAPTMIFPITFINTPRLPGYFWHNIGKADNRWWEYLREHGVISASFSCQPGDEGERILKSYIRGDTVFAYVSKHGAIGFGVIEHPEKYHLAEKKSEEDVLAGFQLHRLPIKWVHIIQKIQDAIPASVLRDELGIYHPVATSASIETVKAKKLIERMLST